jgi:hypothetical protein
MNYSHLATNILWLVPLALQCAMVVAMSLHGLARRYPFFFGYTVLLPARDLVLFFLPYGERRYSNVYWWGEAGAILLSLGVIVQTVWRLIEPYPFLRTFFRIFWIACIFAACAALAMLFWNNGPGGADLALGWVLLFERSARFLQVCLLIAVILLISRIGLTWHSSLVGITAGFGIYAALDLALLELKANLHLVTDNAFVFLKPAAYNLAVLVWAFYFLKLRTERPVESLPSHDLGNWNAVLTDHTEKWYQH